MQGERVVRVQLEGYTADEQTLEVQPTQSHPASFTLVAAVEELPAAPTTRTEAHWANWVVGGALIAGGVAALIAPVHTLARSGECVDEPAPGLCRSEVQFGAVSGVLLGVGVAALAGGVVFLAAQPITVDVIVQPDEASVRVSGAF